MTAQDQGAGISWEAIQTFFEINKNISTFVDLLARLALIASVLLIAYNAIQLLKSFLLLRRMNCVAKRGGILACGFTVLAILMRHPLSLIPRHWNIYIRTRMRVEHEIFVPRPEWVWPPTEGGIDSLGCSAWWRCFGLFIKERANWMWRMMQVGVDQRIEVDDAGEVNDRFVEISRYFETIRSLDPINPPKPSFACEVMIRSGFVAPLHLLTGLLAKYNESWERVISQYKFHTRNWLDVPLVDPRDNSGRFSSEDFRQLQSFIYHCWLLWGPSIPVCSKDCLAWMGAYTSLQYGFGDENNSIEIVGDRDLLVDALRKIVPASGEPFRSMALPATVTGVLQYSSTAILESGKFPPVLQTSWRGGQDARPVLYFSEGSSGDAVTGVRVSGESLVGSLLAAVEPEHDSPVSHYYSAYLWIMFAVLRHDHESNTWIPLDPDDGMHNRRSREPWKGTIPFFEHGNIADGESCSFAKQVLADKVIASLLQFIDNWPKGKFPMRFAYSGAIDDTTCGHPLLIPELSGGTCVRERMQARLTGLPAGNPLRRLVDEKIVVWDHFGPQDYCHPHSPCALPRDIRRYYEGMEEGGALDASPGGGGTPGGSVAA